MTRFAGILFSGILLGIFATLFVVRSGSVDANNGLEPDRPSRVSHDSVGGLFTYLEPENGAALVSIDEVMALPTAFERAAGLHILAAQSDAPTLQNLILDTFERAGELERAESLGILFSRLAEISPRDALALARSDNFAGIKQLEQSVWRTWARKDLDEALFEAKTQSSMHIQKSSVQYLYAAFGYMGNDTTDRIQAETGIDPDHATRSRYLYMLADRSIGDAVDFINSVEDSSDRRSYASWLANYLSQGDPHEALIYAGRFSDASAGEYYESVINQSIAKTDPHSAIERLQASGKAGRSNREYRSAVNALAKVDLAAALQYFDQARTSEERSLFGSAIAQAMAKEDPSAAMDWASANDTGQYPSILIDVISRVAQTEPQLALEKALKIPHPVMRSEVVSSVISRLANSDPQRAVTLLDEISDPTLRRDARGQLASAWVRKDADAAVEWILSRGEEEQGEMIQFAASRLVFTDIDSAIRLLPRLKDDRQMGLRQQIAQQLASNVSPDEAQAFIQQFENEPGYEQLQASLISGVAQRDLLMARQMADQLAAGDARDRAYLQIISQRAVDDPTEASRLVARIDNELLRGTATGQVAMQWARLDSGEAERWVASLPTGQARDDAILHMSYQWDEPTASQESLIASIENREKRGQAKIRRAFNLMRSDIAKAREVLEDDDISETQRQQVELMLSQFGTR